MKYVIYFLSIFIIMYVFYLFTTIIGKRKRYNENKMRVEESYIITKYNIDMKKVPYKKFLNLVALSNSFIFGFTFSVVQIMETNIFLQILVGVIIMIPLIMIFYDLIGKYYLKKGYAKDNKNIKKKKEK